MRLKQSCSLEKRVKQNSKRYLTVKQLVQARSAAGRWPDTEPAVRALIFHAKTSGLDKHIRRIRGRVLIDDIGLDEWIERGGA